MDSKHCTLPALPTKGAQPRPASVGAGGNVADRPAASVAAPFAASSSAGCGVGGVAATWHAGSGHRASDGGGCTLPPLGGAAALRRKQLALEEADRVDGLTRQEKNIRAMIVGAEHERRYSLLWAHQRGIVKLRRWDAGLQARRAAQEQQRYAATVLQYQEVGLLVSEEAAARQALLQAEEQDRHHAVAMRVAGELQRDAEALVDEEIRTSVRYDSVSEIRETQMRQMVQYYRSPKADTAPIDQFVTEVLAGGDGDAVGAGAEGEAAPARPPMLMDYAVCEEEFHARQQIRYEEMVARLPAEHAVIAHDVVAAEEARERAAMMDVFALGACQSRLAAAVNIQSWWRLTLRQPWSERRREGMVAAVQVCRNTRSAAAWRLRISKLAARRGSNSSSSSGPEGSGRGEGVEADAAEELRMLEVAATDERRYTLAMDYFLFTLIEQVRAHHDSALHPPHGRPTEAERVVVECLRSRHRVLPHRVYFPRTERYVQSYARHRRLRWYEGYLRTQRAREAVMGDEAAARADILQLEALDHGSLETVAACVGRGTVSELEAACAVLFDEEAAGRALIDCDAAETRSLLLIALTEALTAAEAALQPFRLLIAEEGAAREQVALAEAEEMAGPMREAHWRWGNLGSYRQRLASRYTTRRGWFLAVRGGGVGANFVSLDTTARVLQRFFRAFMLWRRDHALVPAAAAYYVDDGEAEAVESAWAHIDVLSAQLQDLFTTRVEEAAAAAKALEEAEEAAAASSPHGGSSSGVLVVVRRGEDDGESVSTGGAPTSTALVVLPDLVDGDQQQQQRVERVQEMPSGTLVVVTSQVVSELSADDDDVPPGALVAVVSEEEEVDSAFVEWFDAEAEQPRDLLYKEVLARFHGLHGGFLNTLNHFLILLREGRAKIEAEEAEECLAMRPRLAYRTALSTSVANGERRARMFLEADEEDTRDELFAAYQQRSGVVKWGEAAKSIAPTLRPLAVRHQPEAVVTLSAVARRQQRRAPPALALPALSAIDRLLSREEVRRLAIVHEHGSQLREFLLDYSMPRRRALETLEAEDRPLVCTNVDYLFYNTNPPLAQMAALRCEEAMARERVVQGVLATSYASPLLRAHSMYLCETLWPQFLVGHLVLSSNGAYMDRRLRVLLTQRLGHMSAKLNDLVQLETAARSRMEHLEDVTRQLRFVYHKLAP